jgi:hypothetical protein
MLRTGVRAPGKVDVDRLVELHAPFEILREREGLALGVGGGPLAARVAGAGHESAGDVGRLVVQAEAHQLAFHRLDKRIRHVRQQEILPRREPEVP